MNNSGLVKNNQQSYYHLNFYERASERARSSTISILAGLRGNEYELRRHRCCSVEDVNPETSANTRDDSRERGDNAMVENMCNVAGKTFIYERASCFPSVPPPACITWSSETFGQPASQRCNKLKTITTKPSPKRIILLDVGVERLRRLRNGEDLRIEWLSGEGENVLSGWNFSLNQHEINSSTVNIHSPFKESLYPLIPFNCRLN